MRWSDLARLIARLVAEQPDDQTRWTLFAHELVSFLKEQNLSEELMTLNDLAVLNVFLPSTDLIEATISHVWHGRKPLWKLFCQQLDQRVVYSTDYGCISAFRYLKHAAMTGSGLFNFGIRFPQITQLRKQSSEDSLPYIFVELEDANASAVLQPSVSWIFWQFL